MTSPPIPSGMVTAADLFGEITATRRDLAQILTKVEVMNAGHAAVAAAVADHENRIRALAAEIPAGLDRRLTSLERWQWRAGGVVAVLAILGGVVAGLLEALIAHAR